MLLTKEIRKTIVLALNEDSARRDITTSLAIPKATRIKVEIIAKEKGLLCGIEVAKAVFKQINKKVIFKALKKDGATLKPGQRVAIIAARARDILAAERVALNFLSFLSAVATNTEKFVHQSKGNKAIIMDTRKTIPNLRQLQRYAVLVGGGRNHRSCLSGAVLIKDNHLRIGRYLNKGKLDDKKIAKLVKNFRKKSSGKIEIEIEELSEFRQVAQAKPDIIMLDNFSLADLKKAVSMRNESFPRLKLEASGGITLKNVRAVARSGVDRISIGCLTHSLKSIDFSLEVI
ncbi:MAG: carboxylating nicotinate-nucleotide diphosphorylase [Candidatus Omnitrophica bacterium]|nr:carboxylating nicotinate-nucleotide diphosphorylase [Candidatus Omnitrophota bacterium]